MALSLLTLLLLFSHFAYGLEAGRLDLDGHYGAVVSLVAHLSDQCSATKIAPRVLLTAAHCVVDTSSGDPRPAFRTDGVIGVSNAPVPRDRDDYLRLSVRRTRLAPAFSAGMTRFLEFKRKRIAAYRAQFAGTELLRRMAEMEAKHHFTARFPDLALVELNQEIPSIPTAELDLGALAANDTVTLVGYGCERLAGRDQEQREHPFGRRRWAQTRVIRVDAVNFYTYAAHLLAGAPSLCPGDSGGPVLRDGKVVGVHGTVYGIGAAGGAHSNMSVNLHALRDWEPLRGN